MKQLFRDQNGNVMILTALMAPLLLGAGGLGIDMIQWTLMQRMLQRQADSAALAGALARMQGANARNSALASIQRDNLVVLSASPVIENAPTSGTFAGNSSAVRVRLQTSRTLPLSSMFLKKTPIISAEATASAVTEGTFCVVSLERSNTTGITLQGNASVDMGCGLATNSPATAAVSAGGSSYVLASPISAVGGIPASGSFAPNTVLLRHSLPQSDPFTKLANPAITSCNPILNVNPNSSIVVNAPGGSACYRGMDIKGTVRFTPGTYYIDGGKLSVGAQGVVIGDNVTFVLTSSTAASNPSSIATVNINGGATLQLSASTSGTFAGVLLYQDRRATNASNNQVNGNATSRLQGAFYLPSQGLTFSGTAGMDTRCLQLVSRRVTFIGNARIQNQCPTNSGAKSFDGTRVFLVG
ncbi:pilus assembly protein TadG-related protein [Qipengyuania sp. CAU 1752]